MNATSSQLLKLLSSGIQPGALPFTSGLGAAGIAGTPFADLLKQAQSGAIASQLPVTINASAQSAGIQLNDGQLARLAQAADKLETAGVRTAMVSIDGQNLVLDVHARQITGSAQAQNGIVSGVDGVIDLGDLRSLGGLAVGAAQAAAGAAAGLGGTLASALSNFQLGPPSAGLAQNASLTQLLAQLSGVKPASAG